MTKEMVSSDSTIQRCRKHINSSSPNYGKKSWRHSASLKASKC